MYILIKLQPKTCTWFYEKTTGPFVCSSQTHVNSGTSPQKHLLNKKH